MYFLLYASLLWLTSLLFLTYRLLYGVLLLPTVDLLCCFCHFRCPFSCWHPWYGWRPTVFSTPAIVSVLMFPRSCYCWHLFWFWCFMLLASSLLWGVPAVVGIHAAIGFSAVAGVLLLLTFLLLLCHHCCLCPLSALRIHNISVWIRIRIRGSMPLTNGSASFYFHRWPSICQQKTNLILKSFTSFFKDKKSKTKQ